MATRPESSGRKATRAPPPLQAYTIKEFAAAFRISQDMFFRLMRQGFAPRVMKVGARTLISVEAAEEWRREREAVARGEPVAPRTPPPPRGRGRPRTVRPEGHAAAAE